MPARCWESKTDAGPVLQGLELENETGKQTDVHGIPWEVGAADGVK